MTFESIYCPTCCHCYPRVEDAHTLPCGHSMVGAVRVMRETVGKYEYVDLKFRNSSQVRFWLRPDGNGRRLVEHKKQGHKKWSLSSLPAFLGRLEARAPVLAEAFEARRDVRRKYGNF